MTHKDVPATVGLVMEVRDELKAEIRSEIYGVKKEIHEVKAEIHEVKSEVHGVKAEVHGLKSQMQEVLKSVHHTQVLMEEQRSENRIVLDGLKNMMDRQDRIESEITRSF